MVPGPDLCAWAASCDRAAGVVPVDRRDHADEHWREWLHLAAELQRGQLTRTRWFHRAGARSFCWPGLGGDFNLAARRDLPAGLAESAAAHVACRDHARRVDTVPVHVDDGLCDADASRLRAALVMAVCDRPLVDDPVVAVCQPRRPRRG